MTRDAATVLASLIGATDDEILDLLRLERRFRQEVLEHIGQQVVRTHLRERPGMAAEWSAETFVNICVEHVGILCQSFACNRNQGSGVRSDTPSCARRVSQMFGR